jgi:hypothetical protein
MSRVLHLIGHDLRTHRRFLLAWAAIVIAHPLVAMLPWSGRPLAATLGPAVLLVVARLIVGTVVLGPILQQDSPIDDRAFWRTRPIAIGEMAAAKLTLAAMLFVLLPLVVVLTVAVAVGVPWAHWPSTVVQVLFTDAALVGLTMTVATRTRHVSTLLIAIVATLLVTYLLLVFALELRRIPSLAGWVDKGGLDPDLALPTMAVWASVGLWTATAIGMAGPRRRNAFAAAGAATFAVLLVTWFVPQARVHHRRGDDGFGLTAAVDGRRVRAVTIPGRGDLVGIIATPTIGGAREGDRTQAYLLDGRLTGPTFDRAARGEQDPRSVVSSLNAPHTPLLAVLTPAEFTALAGSPVRFIGRLNLDTSRARLVSSSPVAAGAGLEGLGVRLTIDRVREWSDDVPRPIADGRFVETYVPGLWRAQGHEYRLRDIRTGCSARLYPQSSLRGQIGRIALLPTLARPFTVQPTTVVAMVDGGCRPGPANAVVELHELRSRVQAVQVTVDFTMPSAVEPILPPAPRG